MADVNAARDAGVAVPASSKSDYLDAVASASAMQRSSDAKDASIGWTASSNASYPEPDGVPGQLFSPAQLPDPASALAYGLTPQRIPEHLITEEKHHPQGPEPSDIAQAEARSALADAVAAHAVNSAQTVSDAQAANVATAAPKKAAAPPTPAG